MTNEEWQYHREHGVSIYPLGLCSRTQNGRIKIEGYEPMTENQASDHVFSLAARWRATKINFDIHETLRKLRALS
jgi:hypothetical protein